MSDFFKEQYLTNFNNFIDQLQFIFPDDETKTVLAVLKGMSDETKINNSQTFCNSITGENFDLFLKSKIKVFSHKSPNTLLISESLFGSNFSLKNILNNQPEEVKKIIWLNLHTLNMLAELMKPDDKQNKNNIVALNNLINGKQEIETLKLPHTSNNEARKRIQQMLGVDINNDTTDMIDDIVASFERVLSGSGGNPLSGIMEISQTISTKYANKINSGDIELGKLMDSITTKVPGMDQMMKSMKTSGFSGTSTVPKEKVIIDENFSTADVIITETHNDNNGSGMKIGNMLKMADQFGVLPGGKTSEGMPSLSGLPGLDNIPGIGKMMEMMQKLEKAESQDDAAALKLEMDSYLEKELGVDVNALNSQLDMLTKNMSQ
jgi:hypothetical protein